MSRTPPVRKPKVVEKNRQDRRDFILSKAAIIFAEKSYQASTTEMIADETSLNKGTIYYYYTSKSDILYDICYGSAVKAVEIAESSKSEDVLESIRLVTVNLMRWFQERQAAVSVYFHEEYILQTVLSEEQYKNIREIQRKFMTFFYKLIEDGVNKGVFAPVDVRINARLMVGMIVGSRRWPHIEDSFAQVADAIISILIKGLAK